MGGMGEEHERNGSQHPAVLELESLPHRTDLVVECDSDATELGSRIHFINSVFLEFTGP
jgi:hypothetical protein